MIRESEDAANAVEEEKPKPARRARADKNGTLKSQVRQSRAKERELKLLAKIVATKELEQELLQKNGKHSDELPGKHPEKPRKKRTSKPKSGTFVNEMGHSAPPEQGAAASEAAQEPEVLTAQIIYDKQTKAMVALLMGKSNIEAAEDAGVDRRTVYRWRQQPDFQADLHRLQSNRCIEMRKLAGTLAGESVEALKHAITCGDVTAAIELLEAINIWDGKPLTEVDGLDADSTSDPAVVFPNPLPTAEKPHDEAATAAPSAKPDEPSAAEPASTAPCETAEPVPQLTLPGTFDWSDLFYEQQLAMVELLSGKSLMEAAKAADVPYDLVRLWMNVDVLFRDVLRTCRQQRLQQLQSQLLDMGFRALECLRFAIRRGNTRAAFAILCGLKVIK